MTELSGYVFSPLREVDFSLFRGTGDGLAPILLVTNEDASLASRKQLEHECALGIRGGSCLGGAGRSGYRSTTTN